MINTNLQPKKGCKLCCIFFSYQMTELQFSLNNQGLQMLNTTAQDNKPMFMIVPRAKDGMWESYYGRDPKTHAMPQQASAFYKLSGAAAKLKLQYTNPEEAQQDLEKLLKIDPTGGYAVCQIDFFSHEKPYLHYENKIAQAA